MSNQLELLRSRSLISKITGSTDPAPTAQSLYTYQVTDDQYQKVKEILARNDLNTIKNYPYFSALFALYASEWWRRAFDGGHWKWDPLLQDIGVSYSSANNPVIYEISEKGLRFWGRSVLRTQAGHRDFLGSFAVEGGLPINQLNTPNNWIERVLKSSLEHYREGITDLEQIVTQRFAVITVPEAFKNASSRETIINVIKAIYDLNAETNFSKQTDPVTYLNDAKENWRNNFPIPLDNEQGKLLLSSLIKTASIAVQKNRPMTTGFKLNRFASLKDNELTVEAYLYIAEKVTLDTETTNGIRTFVDNNANVIDIELHYANRK